jgi:hypothetical protein
MIHRPEERDDEAQVQFVAGTTVRPLRADS